jgi:glycosyltransferase involved in cell wall biosynthesis
MPVCAIVSFRLGLTDGVSIVATRWAQILEGLGFEIVTVAGEGPVDRTIAGLAIDATDPPSSGELEAALDGADLVVAENICTIPLNLPASRVVAATLQGRRALLHHHDPPWQRTRFSHISELPPTDPMWQHVTINDFTRAEFEARGIEAVTIRNPFDTTEPPGNGAATRRAIGAADERPLVVHPVRAIERKNIPAAIALTEALQGTYWLMGEPEEGYGPALEPLLAAAACPVIHRGWPSMADAYAAADLVAFPSLWEGFGNPPIEASIHRRPCCVGDYPAATELRDLGFRWFAPAEVAEMKSFLESPDEDLLDRNHELAAEHFSMEAVGSDLSTLLDERGWLP